MSNYSSPKFRHNQLVLFNILGQTRLTCRVMSSICKKGEFEYWLKNTTDLYQYAAGERFIAKQNQIEKITFPKRIDIANKLLEFDFENII